MLKRFDALGKFQRCGSARNKQSRGRQLVVGKKRVQFPIKAVEFRGVCIVKSKKKLVRCFACLQPAARISAAPAKFSRALLNGMDKAVKNILISSIL